MPMPQAARSTRPDNAFFKVLAIFRLSPKRTPPQIMTSPVRLPSFLEPFFRLMACCHGLEAQGNYVRFRIALLAHTKHGA